MLGAVACRLSFQFTVVGLEQPSMAARLHIYVGFDS